MTTRIDIYPNYTFISGTFDPETIDEATRFRKSGYRFADAYKRHGWDGYTRLFNRKQGGFPTGLKDRVLRIYKKKYPNISIEVEDHREFKSNKRVPPVEKIPLEGVTLRPHQVRAGNAMLKKKHGVLWSATNSGKTEVAIAVIKALDLPTLFLVKGKDLVVQTYERFKTRLGAEDIGIIMANKWEPRKFTVASADTLARRFNPARPSDSSQQRQEQVKELLDGVKVVVIDECHTAASAGLWNIVRYCKAPYRYGLSGTPFKRGDNQDLKLVALTGEVCCKITNKEMIEHGISVPTEIKILEVDNISINGGTDFVEAYEQGVILNSYRNRMICELVEQFYDENKNTLIIVKNISHGDLLNDLLYTFKRESFIPHEFIHGDTNLEERTQTLNDFKNGLLKVLITSSILDQGIDIPNIDVLIFAAAGKSYIRSIQRVGRGLRLGKDKDKLTVIDFCDKTNKYLAKHSLERILAYKREECFSIDVISSVDQLT